MLLSIPFIKRETSQFHSAVTKTTGTNVMTLADWDNYRAVMLRVGFDCQVINDSLGTSYTFIRSRPGSWEYIQHFVRA